MDGKVAIVLSRAEAYEALVLIKAALTYRADRGNDMDTGTNTLLQSVLDKLDAELVKGWRQS